MNDDIIFGALSDLPRSITSVKKDIKFIVPEGTSTNQYVPVYADDVKEAFLDPQVLQAKKTATFPWSSNLTQIETLAGNLFISRSTDPTQTIETQGISNVNSADNSVIDEYTEGTV